MTDGLQVQSVTRELIALIAALRLMVRSVPLVLASRMLGHKSTRITEAVYVHLAVNDLRPAADATAALLPAAKAHAAPGLLRRLARVLGLWRAGSP